MDACNAHISVFLSTPSARRATRQERDLAVDVTNFYPRPPRGGRQHSEVERAAQASYFYPRPPRGGRPLMPDFRFCSKVISIHALREEGDLDTVHKLTDTIKFLSTPSARRATRRLSQGRSGCCISIHALREEGDTRPPSCSRFLPAFLSTPSARRATPRCRTAAHSPWYFYPRPPRGGRLAGNRFMVARKGFLSTPSARRATSGGQPDERR